tara:strand:- start:258 stop:539 length:282 start_codon:yes stop_codon:yes gene_type:complete
MSELKQELLDDGHMTVQELINKLGEVEDKTVPITLEIKEKDGGEVEQIHHALCYCYDIDNKLEEIQISIGYDSEYEDNAGCITKFIRNRIEGE